MSSSWKYVEKCTILIDMAEGLCCRLYNAKNKFADPETNPSCLSSKELSKVRDKLEKSFPESPDLTKVSGYDGLRHNCHGIASELSFFNDIILDVCDFRKAAVFLLKDIAASTLQHFTIDKHRPIVLLFFELLTGLYRVLTLLGHIPERKSVFATFTTANALASEATDVAGVSDASVLFIALSHGPRLFIDDFFQHAEFVGNMMLELVESLQVHFNTENLRSKGILNPSNDGDTMTHPVKTPLTARPDRVLAMHTELRDAGAYLEHIALGFLVCPSLLLHPEAKYMELFRVAATDQLVVTLYRELNINIHAEYENVYSNFPSKKDTINVPKGLKIKTVVKEIAIAAAQSVGLKHRERRSFILAEIKNLLHIANTLPGLLGPKFPVFVAAASMARCEILHYFRHRPLECRKDVKKHLNSNDYYSSQITFLIEALYELSCVVEKYREVVTLYYSEYLSVCDGPALQTLCKDALDELPSTANPAISTILLSLPTCVASGGAELEGLRMNWDRYSTLLGTVWGNKFAAEGNAALTAYMAGVRDRSEFVDHLPQLMKKYFLPREIWWHMPALLESFEKGFEHNAMPLTFFPVLSLVSLNLHEDHLVEAKELSRKAWKCCDQLMGKLNTRLTADLDTYWSLYDELERKTLGKEAMSRLEKQYSLKQAKDKALASGKKDPSLGAGGQASVEQHPGYESEGWAHASIASLVKVRQKLLRLMAAVKNTGTFFVFDREYNLEFAIRDAFYYYFSRKLQQIIAQKGEISRPSLSLKSIVVGCRVMQSLCNIVSFDLPQVLRTFLFENFCDTIVTPPGTVLTGTYLGAEQKEELIWPIARWFIKFVDEASAQNSGLMWLPSINTFARADSKQRPIEMYINREEIASLCAFVGPQGVRCIDSMLIQVVAEKVATMKSFLATNKNVLFQFNRNMASLAPLSGMEASASFMTAAVKAGVALAVREILHQGLSDSMQVYAPFLKSSVSSITASVHPWEQRDVTTPLYSLAFDVGVVPAEHVDLSLLASLSPLANTDEDRENFTLLPAAFAACFALPYWAQNSIFLPEFGAFRGNQHCVALTMAKCLLCFTDASSVDSFPASLKSNADKFIELAANVILLMRDQKSSFNSHPIRAYTNILELFLRFCPLMDHYSLEKFLPYAFVHASQMEIAMGQVRGGDSISAGMSRVIQAETAATTE